MNLASIQLLLSELVLVFPTLCLQIICLIFALKGLEVHRKAAILAVYSFSLFTANTLLTPVFSALLRNYFNLMYSKSIYGLTPLLFIYTITKVALSVGAWVLLAIVVRQLFKKTGQCNLAT
jgi:hypothetical protein